MSLHTPVFMQPATGDASIIYTGQELRQLNQAILTMARSVGNAQGIVVASGYKVTQRGAGANLTVDVASGLSWVIGDDVTSQGPYLVWNDGTVNVGPFTVPGSGTFNHRLVLQIEDKLNNGTWTGYQAVPLIIPDTGGGLQPEPNSAITLAVIQVAVAQASILNANIIDYRELIGPVNATKASGLGRSNATLSDDPDLQLLNLAANAEYILDGDLFYNGVNDSGNTGIGGLAWTWRVSSGTGISYRPSRINPAGQFLGAYQYAETDTVTAQTQGPAVRMAVRLDGRISTGAAPAYAVLQWGQNNTSGTATNLVTRSYLRAVREG